MPTTTVTTTKPMTKQQVFDKVATHLLTQGKASRAVVGGEVGCAYRGEDGTSCAVGCLLPDELYDPEMEGKNAKWVLSYCPAFKDLFVPGVWSLLASLHSLHDYCSPLAWEQGLLDIAAKYGLKINFPTSPQPS